MTVIPTQGDPIVIYQNDTFLEVFTLYYADGVTPIPLSGKKAVFAGSQKIYDTAPTVLLTTENGGIVLGASDGTITIKMSKAQTVLLSQFVGTYDLHIIDDTVSPIVSDRYAMGPLTISPSNAK